MECINCGNDVTVRYCANCGQRAGIKRITLKDSLKDFWTLVVGLDGFFLRTLTDLTRRPGYVAREYIRGVRVKYFGPIAYFFFMITLLLLFINILGLDFAELIQDKQTAFAVPEAANQRGMARVTRWVADNIKWILFLAVPFQAFAARFFFFRKSGFNFIEHTVPLFYTTGHLFWLTLLTFTYRSVTGELPFIYTTILSFLYFGYTYSNLMTYQSKVKAFFKGMGVYLGGQVVFAVVMIIVMTGVLIVLSLINPEVLKDFRPSAK